MTKKQNPYYDKSYCTDTQRAIINSNENEYSLNKELEQFDIIGFKKLSKAQKTRYEYLKQKLKELKEVIK